MNYQQCSVTINKEIAALPTSEYVHPIYQSFLALLAQSRYNMMNGRWDKATLIMYP